ncbi:MAG: hypothetical protein ABJ308_14930 [Halieaceae bacterium]
MKSSLSSFWSKVRFLLERWVVRGLHYRLGLAAFIIGLVALVAGQLVYLLAPGDFDLGEEIWWAFLRLSDPGYLGDDVGLARRTISTVVTVLGYVLFLGLLIAIMTQWLNQWLARLEAGIGPVSASHHILILGWTYRTVAIVNALLRAQSQLDRFLSQQSQRELTIVILAQEVSDARRLELRDKLGSLWSDRQVLLRTGSTQRLDDLARAGFDRAAVIILPGPDFSEANPDIVDAESVKSLLSISTALGRNNDQNPLAVTGLHNIGRAELAQQAYGEATQPVAVDEIVSRLIATCVYQPGLGRVYRELLDMDRGNDVYVRGCPEFSGQALGVIQQGFPRAIVIGLIRQGSNNVELLPEPEKLLGTGDLLVMIARSLSDCVPGPEEQVLPQRTAKRQYPLGRSPRRLLILGWNRKVRSLLDHLNYYTPRGLSITIVDPDCGQLWRERLGTGEKTIDASTVEFIEKDFLVREVLEDLDPAAFDAVVVAARQQLGNRESVDASAVMTQLLLHEVLKGQVRRPHLLFEILSAANEHLFTDARDDILDSARIVGFVLSHVALRRELASVFAGLSSPGGPELLLINAAVYVSSDETACFSDLQRIAHERGEIAVGLYQVHADGPHLELNPERLQQRRFSSEDQIVVLAMLPDYEQAAPDSATPA